MPSLLWLVQVFPNPFHAGKAVVLSPEVLDVRNPKYVRPSNYLVYGREGAWPRRRAFGATKNDEDDPSHEDMSRPKLEAHLVLLLSFFVVPAMNLIIMVTHFLDPKIKMGNQPQLGIRIALLVMWWPADTLKV